jgi:hypothetical protein
VTLATSPPSPACVRQSVGDAPLGFDAAAEARFEARARAVFKSLTYVHVTLIVAHLIFGAKLGFTALHLTLALLFYTCVRLIRDPVKLFVYCHPTILFSMTPYLYSTFAMKTADEGLFDPFRSSLIAALYQLGMYGPAIISVVARYLTTERPRALSRRPALTGALVIPAFYRTLTLLGAAGILVRGMNISPFVNAISDQAQSLFWVGLALHLFARRQLYPLSADIIFALLICGAVTVMANARSFLLEILFFMGTAHLMLARKAFGWRWLVPVWLLISTLNTFSAITIEIRYTYPKGSPDKTAAYVQTLTSPEALAAIFIPGRKYIGLGLSGRAEASSRTLYNTPYFKHQSGFFERLTLLPAMDIVTGRMGEVSRVNEPAIKELFRANLPFVSGKDLLYSDRVTWELGLRNRDVIGRPMITSAGELYTMAGYGAVLLFGLGFSSFLIIEYNLLVKICGSYIVAALLFLHILLYATITSTALSCTALVFRSLPIMLLTLAVLVALTSGATRPAVSPRLRSRPS